MDRLAIRWAGGTERERVGFSSGGEIQEAGKVVAKIGVSRKGTVLILFGCRKETGLREFRIMTQ